MSRGGRAEWEWWSKGRVAQEDPKGSAYSSAPNTGVLLRVTISLNPSCKDSTKCWLLSQARDCVLSRSAYT